MSGLEFSASVIQSLAWPVTLAVAVFVLRTPIAKALTGPAVKRWKLGPSGVEVENWDSEVSDVRSKIVEAVEESPRHEPPTNALDSAWRLGLIEELSDLARVSPTTAVLESFHRIETELREMAQGSLDKGLTVRQLPMGELTQFALNQGLITPETANAIMGLTVLRNLAAHSAAGSKPDTARSLEFAALAEAVLYTIRNPRLDQPSG